MHANAFCCGLLQSDSAKVLAEREWIKLPRPFKTSKFQCKIGKFAKHHFADNLNGPKSKSQN